MHTESENSLTEAGVIFNSSQVEIFCSPVMDCLVLIGDCLNSDILLPLYVHSNDTKVMTITANRHYSIAFFGINNSTDSLDQPLEKHPGKVMNIVTAYSEDSSEASMSIDSVFLFCAVCLFLVIHCYFSDPSNNSSDGRLKFNTP